MPAPQSRWQSREMRNEEGSFAVKQYLALLVVGLIAAWPAIAAAQSTSTHAQRTSNGSVVLPAGTEIAIQTNEAIDSKTARVGQTFPAQVAQDVMSPSGQVLIPKSSEASLVIKQVSSGGTVGNSELALDLNSINVGGRPYRVASEAVTRSGEGIGKNKRTAEMVGGGAALGTLLGAIAGGGKGAAIGAAAGAATGGTAQVLTKGKEVNVPAETVLKFKLDAPLRLTPAGY
jgi:hypothetical protein